MYTTAECAAACGVEKVTIRSWLARSPGFHLGEYHGAAKFYTRTEAMTLLIASELIGRGVGVPSEVLPAAERIARSGSDRTVWISPSAGGQLAVHDTEPGKVAIALPLHVLALRLGPPGAQRMPRMTR